MSFTRKREESKLPSRYVLIGVPPKSNKGFRAKRTSVWMIGHEEVH